MPTLDLVGDELPVAVFATIREVLDKKHFKVATEAEIIEAFHRVKEKGGYDDFFQNYPFDVDGFSPRCGQLYDGLDAMQQARLMRRQNPDLVNYEISPAIKYRFNAFRNQLTATGEGRLKSLAKAIATELKAES